MLNLLHMNAESGPSRDKLALHNHALYFYLYASNDSEIIAVYDKYGEQYYER